MLPWKAAQIVKRAWNCASCTFSNSGERTTCEMCGGAAPVAGKIAPPVAPEAGNTAQATAGSQTPLVADVAAPRPQPRVRPPSPLADDAASAAAAAVDVPTPWTIFSYGSNSRVQLRCPAT